MADKYTKGEQELRDLIVDTLYLCKCGAHSASIADTLMAIPKIKAKISTASIK